MALTFLTNSSCTSCLTISLSTASLNFFKSAGAGFNLSASNLSMTSLSISYFKVDKLAFLANFDVSTPVAFF